MGLANVRDRATGEGRQQVATQDTAIASDRRGPQVRPLVYPRGRVLGEGDETGVRINPIARQQVSFGSGEPAFGGSLGGKGLTGGAQQPVRCAIAGLPLARR
jgi:hypothetical protein